MKYNKQFRLGAKEFWDLSRELGDKGDEEFNPAMGKKKGTEITVKKSKLYTNMEANVNNSFFSDLVTVS